MPGRYLIWFVLLVVATGLLILDPIIPGYAERGAAPWDAVLFGWMTWGVSYLERRSDRE